MSGTSAAAREFLKDDLAAAANYGSDQEAYVASTLFEEFYRNSLRAIVVAAMPNIKSQHERRLLEGPSEEGEATLTAYRIEAGGSLKIMFQEGEGALLTWKDKSDDKLKTTDIDVTPYITRLAPSALLARDEMLASGATLRDMFPLAAEFARHGHPYGGADEDGGSIGRVKIMAFHDDDHERGRGYTAPSCQRIDLLEKISSALDLSADLRHIDFEIRDHLQLAKDGLLLPMFASAAALAFETDIIARLPELAEIVALSSDLKLGNGTMFAYGDTDRHVYAVASDDKHIIVHNNIDLNEQNVFVIALNRNGGEYTSVDIYIADAWHHNFEEWADRALDDRADPHGFSALVEYTAKRQKRPNEDELVTSLLEGRPEQGLAYSYDMATGTLELGEAAFRTGFLPYARVMIEQDLEALRTLRSGDIEDAWGMSVQHHEIGSRSISDERDRDPAEYLASLGLPPSPNL